MTMSGFNWPSRSTITMVAGDPGDSTSTSVLSTYQTSSDTTLMTVSYTDTVSSTPSVVISSGSSTVSSTSAVVISSRPSTVSPIISTSSPISRNPGPGNTSISTPSVRRPEVASVSSNSSARLGAGAIAGIAVGGILLLVLIVCAWFFWRLRKRLTPAVNSDEDLGRRDEKVTFGASAPTDFTGVFNDTAFHGLPVTGQRHELEPPRYHKSDLVHELDGSSRPGELPSKDASSHTVECLKVADAGNIETTDDVAFDGEAQRRREVEWLEKEEARIRHKRETLLQQRVQRLV
ncbi:hypothetical protein Ptr902_02920 [Pyrenophora tritici-repentis]|nr:hypothetical protein Ptr902_02920 [Pyrenophora tritici-repentis]